MTSRQLRAQLGLAGLLSIQLLWVRPTNFGGLDEWLILELTSRGVVSVPYAYRPLGLIWPLPASLLATVLGFGAFRVFYGLYALACAGLVLAIARRLLPERPLLAMLTSCFAIVWAPNDMARLSTVEGAVYQGITLGALLAVWLLLKAWRRQSVGLFALSVLLAFLAIRCYEGCAALLAFAPALLLFAPAGPRRLWRWALVWECVVGIAAAFVLLEVSMSPRQSAYQLSVLSLQPEPFGWVVRMARQYALHLSALATPTLGELLTPSVPAAVTAFLLALALVRRDLARQPHGRRVLAIAAVLGLVLAGLGYSLALLGVASPSAFRLQFLSGPGIALCLASVVQLVGSLFKHRGQFATVALLGAWVVAVGTGRTAAMQREWEDLSYYPRQTRMLAELVRRVPQVEPNTLILLIDEGRAWQASFSFHHAVQYLYGRRAAGHVPNRMDTMYAAAPVANGVLFEPWPIVRRAWHSPRALYRYDELVVLRHVAAGEVVLLDAWPEDLSPLPEGATYAPRGRIVSGPLPRATILTRSPRPAGPP